MKSTFTKSIVSDVLKAVRDASVSKAVKEYKESLSMILTVSYVRLGPDSTPRHSDANLRLLVRRMKCGTGPNAFADKVST